jgi:2-phosphosulfolactate phosphatase
VIVRTASLLEGARGATDHAVIVDVFRAFTTAAFCVAAGANEIVLLADHAEALAMKREDPSLFLTGEIDGRPIAGFDAGNSPSVIVDLDLHGRRVVQRSSSGTQGVVAAARADAILLGSLVTAAATARYLARHAAAVTLVSMGDGGTRPNEEDPVCVDYLAALLGGEPFDVRAAIAALPQWGNERWPDWFPRRDAELACEIDRFDFALPVARENGLLVARPVRT